MSLEDGHSAISRTCQWAAGSYFSSAFVRHISEVTWALDNTFFTNRHPISRGIRSAPVPGSAQELDAAGRRRQRVTPSAGAEVHVVPLDGASQLRLADMIGFPGVVFLSVCALGVSGQERWGPRPSCAGGVVRRWGRSGRCSVRSMAEVCDARGSGLTCALRACFPGCGCTMAPPAPSCTRCSRTPWNVRRAACPASPWFPDSYPL